MNLAITLGRKGDKWDVISMPHDGSLRDQLKDFNALGNDTSVRAKYSEIQLWSQSGGRLKRQVFDATDGKRVLTLEELMAADAVLNEQKAAKAAESATVAPTEAASADAPADDEAPAQGSELLG